MISRPPYLISRPFALMSVNDEPGRCVIPRTKSLADIAGWRTQSVLDAADLQQPVSGIAGAQPQQILGAAVSLSSGAGVGLLPELAVAGSAMEAASLRSTAAFAASRQIRTGRCHRHFAVRSRSTKFVSRTSCAMRSEKWGRRKLAKNVIP